jgi:hypothetical protein
MSYFSGMDRKDEKLERNNLNKSQWNAFRAH